MLNKAKQYCEKHNISPKTISLKVLCPLLDYAALEENETLQDKWAILLSNMVDSEQNIANHVFPYLLSQVSTNEFMLLQKVWEIKSPRIEDTMRSLSEFKSKRLNEEEELRTQLKVADDEIAAMIAAITPLHNREYMRLRHQKLEHEENLRNLKAKEQTMTAALTTPEYIQSDQLKAYEFSNLIRLGVVKVISRSYGYVKSHQIENDPDSKYLRVDGLEVEIEADQDDYILTELGELFMQACNERKSVT
jgi:hypothetical protein